MGSVFASSDDVEQRLPEGTVVAGIEVVSEIERGGMAVVYRGRRVHDGHPVALKVGTAEAAARHLAQERFQNEARLGEALRHPNIVRPLLAGRLTGPGEFAGRMYLVTELVEGRTLSWLMLYNQQGMLVERAVSLATQVAEAMVAMHEQGIVHRDLTPANIIVDDGDRVHVIDFGLAYALGGEDVDRTPDLTMEGATVGTPLYMSPQQAMHLEPCGAFDVYAFGVLLYELLSGAAPNSGLPPEEVVAVRCNPKSKLFPLLRVAPDTPSKLVGLIERCLAYDSNERPTAAEIVEHLRGDAPQKTSLREPSDPTMLMRRPSVVAEGARPVGDETMVRLVQGDVQLPAVQRARALALAVESAGQGGEPGEERLIPFVHVVEGAEGNRHKGGGSSTEREFPVVHVDSAQEEGRSKYALVVAFVLLFVAGVAAVAWWPRSSSQADPRESDVEAGSEDPLPQGAGKEPGLEGSKAEPAAEAEPAAKTPVAETELSEEAEGPTARPHSKPKGKPRKPTGLGQKKAPAPQDAKPGPLTPCADDRVEARRASKSNRWKAVLASTDDASCWSSGVERSRLRAKALMNLGRYKACMRETAGQEAVDLVQLYGECFRRANEEKP